MNRISIIDRGSIKGIKLDCLNLNCEESNI